MPRDWYRITTNKHSVRTIGHQHQRVRLSGADVWSSLELLDETASVQALSSMGKSMQGMTQKSRSYEYCDLLSLMIGGTTLANDPKKFRITVTVDELTAETIPELAQRMNCSHSKMASSLLEAGIEDNEWIIRFVTTKAVLGLGERLIDLKDRFAESKSAA